MSNIEERADIEDALVYLCTSANPSGELGARIGLRFYPDELPQPPTYPAVVYSIISARRGYTMDAPDGATAFRFQFDLYAHTARGCRVLRAALQADLEGASGEVPTSPPVLIQGAFVDNEADSTESPLERSGVRVKRKRVDMIIWTKEG